MEITIKNPTIIKPIEESLTNPYISLATSDNTRKSYRSDIRHFESWGGKLPAPSDMIAHYLNDFASTLNPRTLSRRLIAIRHWHEYQGFQDPTNHPAIKKTMIGITRAHGKPKLKARPLLLDELMILNQHLVKEDSLASIRDNTILLVGFFGGFRRSELVAIQYEHINWLKEGIEILIPASKTDQNHEGQFCAIPYGNGQLCPIIVLKKWLKAANIQTGFIFRGIHANESISIGGLTPLSINHIIKKRAREVNLPNIELLSSHSMRRGLATQAAKLGTPIHAIMRAGRWKQTNTVMEYIEATERFIDNAAANILKKLDVK